MSSLALYFTLMLSVGVTSLLLLGAIALVQRFPLPQQARPAVAASRMAGTQQPAEAQAPSRERTRGYERV